MDGNLEPVSSSWRTTTWPSIARPVLNKNGDDSSYQGQSSDLTVHTLAPSQSYCTWVGSHNYLDVVAFHSVSRNRNIFRVVQMKLNQDEPTKSSMEAVSQIKLERPGSLASMADNTIAIAMEDGTIGLYNLKDSSTRKFIEEPKKVSTLSVPIKVAGTGTPTMSTSLSSTGAEKRRFPTVRQAMALDLTANGVSGSGSTSSTSPQRLLAQLQDAIYVWDVSRPDAPMQTIRSTIPTSRAARWCPLSPNHQHLSRGSTNGTVKIYDLRSRDPSDPIWLAKKAHQGVIRDLQWNPFIPYWFATSGTDAVIQIWDTRYGAKPVRSLVDHSNAVNALSWSPTNADILASGGADRRFKLWNLRLEPHYVTATLGVWDSAIVGVGWSHTRPRTPAFAVSATGVVQAALPSSDFLLPMVPSLDGPQKDTVKKVERAIYTRDFANGFQRAYQLAQQFLGENRISQANKLLNICYQRQTVTEPAFSRLDKSASSSIDLKSESKSPEELAKAADLKLKLPPPEMRPTITLETYEKDLLFYSYYIPPNYPDHLWPAVDQKLMFSIEALKMSIDLEQFIRDEDASELVKITPEVADFMKRDPNSVDMQILFRLFTVLLPTDFLASLDLGHQLARVFSRNPTAFYSICNMIMFPTLYDTNLNRDAVYGDALASKSKDGKRSGEAPSTPDGKSDNGYGLSPSSSSELQRSPGSAAAAAALGGGGSTSIASSHKLYVGIQNAASALNTEITSGFMGDQLEFLYKFYKTLWGNNPRDALDMFDNNTICLSATTWRIYLNMLTLHRQYDKLFIRGSRLGERVKGFPFADILSNVLGDVVPRIQKHLRDVTSLGMSMSGNSSSRNRRDAGEIDDSNESESVQAVNRLGRAGNMVLNILHNSDARYLPKTLTATLPGSLHQLTVDLETSLREIVDEDNGLEEEERNTRVANALRTISAGITTVIGKREPSGQFLEAINEYRNMIDNNVRMYNVAAGPGGSVPVAGGASKKPNPAASRSRLPSLVSTSSDSPKNRVSLSDSKKANVVPEKKN